tara:strand:- start:755 stop:1159 length:405 start_codon:yes stop_codon:yes gene_type:complete
MSVDYHLALSDHYKAVRARLNRGPPPRLATIAPPPPPPLEPEPEPPAPEPEPVLAYQYTMSTARRIAQAALVPHGMTWADAMSPARTVPYVSARRDVYTALRRHGWSLKKIALFCGRDHTTVLNALHPKKERNR